MIDPVAEFEAALVAEQEAYRIACADKSLGDETMQALREAGDELRRMASIHGPALIARLRAAEAAAPKWRVPTSEGLVEALRLRTLEQLVQHGTGEVILYRWEQIRAQAPRLVGYIGWYDGYCFMDADGEELDMKPDELAGWLPVPTPTEPRP